MRSFIGVLVSLLIVASVAAQRAVMVDPASGEIVYPPNFWVANDEWMQGSSNGAAANRTNLGLGAAWLTNTDATNFRTAIGLGATSDVTFDVVRSTFGFRVESGTNQQVYIGDDVVEMLVPLDIYAAAGISFDGSNAALAAATTRTNLSLGATWLTNTDVTNFRTAIGLGWPALTNTNSGTALLAMNADGEIVYNHTNVEPYIIDRINISARGNFEGYFYVTSQDAIQFQTDQGYDTAGITRTNLQIPWSGLTNTTASNFHRALFPNTNSAPSVTNAVNGWVNIYIGTNTYKLPLYK